jgi:hypothetical protein
LSRENVTGSRESIARNYNRLRQDIRELNHKIEVLRWGRGEQEVGGCANVTDKVVEAFVMKNVGKILIRWKRVFSISMIKS